MEEGRRESLPRIPGLFEYCDRWCERCHLTSRCLVVALVAERRARRRARSGELQSPGALWEEIRASTRDALAALRRRAEEEPGGSETASFADDRDRDLHWHPLVQAARQVFRRSRPFLDRLQGILAARRADLEALPGGPPEEEEIALMRLENCFEVVQWYHTLLVAKTHRALASQAEAEGAPGQEAYLLEDARGTARLVYVCLGRFLGAVHVLHRRVPELQENARVLLALAYRLREGIGAAVPGCREYRRPGLDD
ncbi:MAG: hypothetical protein HY321_08310 [Armatimonadetes bacterium]|nr:hypothetical protein [Armatimonadota bacterium]